MRQDNNSLAHTTWNCKYHIVFAPKYRRQIIYGKYKASIGQILRLLCERKGVEIHEAEACPDHIHMLVSIPPKLSISSLFYWRCWILFLTCIFRCLSSSTV